MFLDGKPINDGFFRVNYILRGLKLPEGQHTLLFTFEPSVFSIGKWISYLGSLLLTLVLAFLAYSFYQRKEVFKNLELVNYQKVIVKSKSKKNKRKR